MRFDLSPAFLGALADFLDGVLAILEVGVVVEGEVGLGAGGGERRRGPAVVVSVVACCGRVLRSRRVPDVSSGG